MSTKGNSLSTEVKYKIALSKQKDRSKIINSLKEYVNLLTGNEKNSLIPSIVSASLYAGISKKALLTWELSTAEDSEVRQLLDFIRDLEEKYLRENGLLNKINGRLASKFLEVDHGMKNEPQQLTQNNTFNVSPELLAEAIEITRSNKSLIDGTKKAAKKSG